MFGGNEGDGATGSLGGVAGWKRSGRIAWVRGGSVACRRGRRRGRIAPRARDARHPDVGTTGRGGAGGCWHSFRPLGTPLSQQRSTRDELWHRDDPRASVPDRGDLADGVEPEEG